MQAWPARFYGAQWPWANVESQMHCWCDDPGPSLQGAGEPPRLLGTIDPPQSTAERLRFADLLRRGWVQEGLVEVAASTQLETHPSSSANRNQN